MKFVNIIEHTWRLQDAIYLEYCFNSFATKCRLVRKIYAFNASRVVVVFCWHTCTIWWKINVQFSHFWGARRSNITKSMGIHSARFRDVRFSIEKMKNAYSRVNLSVSYHTWCSTSLPWLSKTHLECNAKHVSESWDSGATMNFTRAMSSLWGDLLVTTLIYVIRTPSVRAFAIGGLNQVNKWMIAIRCSGPSRTDIRIVPRSRIKDARIWVKIAYLSSYVHFLYWWIFTCCFFLEICKC